MSHELAARPVDDGRGAGAPVAAASADGAAFFDTVPDPAVRAPAALDPHALVLGEALKDRVYTVSATAPRSQQAALGFSEVGHPCARRLSHRLAGTPVVHRGDPLPALFGTGLHQVLADGFARLDAHVGRYLLEQPVSYRGIPGCCDGYDRRLRTVWDWKTTTLRSISRIRREGPPTASVIQVNGYAAGLIAAGETVDAVALVYLPRDGALEEMYVWRSPFDRTVIDAAIDRVDALRGTDPAQVPASTSPLCGWCPFYRRDHTDLATGCPGAG